MRPPLKLCCDVSHLDWRQPAGPAAYARFVLDLLRESGQVDLRPAGEAAAILSLDGRFRGRRGRRSVTAVLDLGHLFHRRGYTAGEWLIQNWRVASAVRRSHHLLVPSDAVRLGLERYLRVPGERITVLAPLPPAEFRRAPAGAVAAVRHRIGLSERYLLFVGTGSRRKNLAVLADAWRRIAAELAPLELVLAGRGAALPAARNLGWVPTEQLVPLLSGAVAFVCPSLYEGSPAGVLEAMSCGTPPLVASTGALARAAHGAGLVLDPHDPGEWAAAIRAVVTDRRLRSGLAAAALKTVANLRAAPPLAGPLLGALGG